MELVPPAVNLLFRYCKHAPLGKLTVLDQAAGTGTLTQPLDVCHGYVKVLITDMAASRRFNRATSHGHQPIAALTETLMHAGYAALLSNTP